MWTQAHSDLPAVIQSMQPEIGDLSRKGGRDGGQRRRGVLAFLVSFVIAGVIMAFGEAGARASRNIFDRIVGIDRGETFVQLSTATIRAVALGVLGVAFIQALLIGLILLVAGVPYAGVLAMIQLVLGIVQVPAAGDAACDSPTSGSAASTAPERQ